MKAKLPNFSIFDTDIAILGISSLNLQFVEGKMYLNRKFCAARQNASLFYSSNDPNTLFGVL